MCQSWFFGLVANDSGVSVIRLGIVHARSRHQDSCLPESININQTADTTDTYRTRMSSNCQLPVSLLDLEVRGGGWYTQGIVVAGIRDHVGR